MQFIDDGGRAMTDPQQAGPTGDPRSFADEVDDLVPLRPELTIASPTGPLAADVSRLRLGEVVVERVRVKAHTAARDAALPLGCRGARISIDVVAADGTDLRRVVRLLPLALVNDLALVGPAAQKQDLTSRVHDHIAGHLSDPELSVQSVAHALGISVRSVHNAFAGRGITPARSIRAARAHAVAGSIRTGATQRSASAMASEFGFPSGAALQRAFRETFGVRIAEYRATITTTTVQSDDEAARARVSGTDREMESGRLHSTTVSGLCGAGS